MRDLKWKYDVLTADPTNEDWGGANGVATGTRVIKQADVVLMLEFFGDEYPLR